MSVAVKIVRNSFRKLTEQGQRAARRRNVELAEEAVKIARRLVPIDTGALKASIRAEVGRSGSVVRVVAGNDKVNYAPFIEYGTRFMSARPFITPANEQVKRTTAKRQFKMYQG